MAAHMPGSPSAATVRRLLNRMREAGMVLLCTDGWILVDDSVRAFERAARSGGTIGRRQDETERVQRDRDRRRQERADYAREAIGLGPEHAPSPTHEIGLDSSFRYVDQLTGEISTMRPVPIRGRRRAPARREDHQSTKENRVTKLLVHGRMAVSSTQVVQEPPALAPTREHLYLIVGAVAGLTASVAGNARNTTCQGGEEASVLDRRSWRVEALCG
jgi:IS1 family transposase